MNTQTHISNSSKENQSKENEAVDDEEEEYN